MSLWCVCYAVPFLLAGQPEQNCDLLCSCYFSAKLPHSFRNAGVAGIDETRTQSMPACLASLEDEVRCRQGIRGENVDGEITQTIPVPITTDNLHSTQQFRDHKRACITRGEAGCEMEGV